MTYMKDDSSEIAPAAETTRADIDERYRWKLEDLYPSIEEWKAHKNALEPRIDKIVEYKGTLTEQAETLLAALRLYFELRKDFYKLHSYAHQLSDQDVRVSAHQELMQEVQSLSTIFGERMAFFVPELTYADPEILKGFLESSPELEEFSMFLQDIHRMREHTLSETEEKLLASVGDVTRSTENVFNIFSNAEFPYPEARLSTGETVTLTSPNYNKHRTSPVREDRQEVMQKFLDAHGQFKTPSVQTWWRT